MNDPFWSRQTALPMAMLATTWRVGGPWVAPGSGCCPNGPDVGQIGLFTKPVQVAFVNSPD
jgi:hypothetical protein